MSESIATVARDQLRALAALLKTAWVSKDAAVLVRQFGALAELAREHSFVELSTLARALSASVLLYVKDGPDDQGRARFMDLGRKVNALLGKDGVLQKKTERQVDAVVDPNFRPVFMLVELDLSQSAIVVRELHNALAARAFALQVFAEGDALTEALSLTTPAALICEAVLMPAMSELLDVIEKEQPGLSMRVPLVAVNKELSAARRLTAALGWADSYLEAPSAVDIANVVAELATPKDEAPYQVLIVDDDRQQAMFCAGVLKRKGMEVKSALSAEAALVELTGMRPDLVLMDLYLPGLNGLELTAILRQRSDSLLLPIVFLSGEQDAQKRFDALNIGGDDYLTKPIRPRHLATAVASRIKRVRALRAQLSEARQPVDTHGLYRRPAFLELLQQQSERPKTVVSATGEAIVGGFVLAYVALDHGAGFLHELGLFAQNALEQEICARLAEAIDAGDAMTSLGNFEYAILAQRSDAERVQKLGDTLRQCIAARAISILQDQLAMSVSVGVIEEADAKKSAERWLTLAQMAAQRGQQRGGNRVERGAHGALRAAPARQKVIEELLGEPTTRNNTTIEYQPIVPLRGAALPQYAQLLRLRGNTVSTASLTRNDYAELADRVGALVKLDRFATVQAIQAIRESARFGGATRMFVRLSVAALQGDIASVLKNEFGNGTIDAAQLVLEFDLHELELELASVTRKLDALRALGVSICLHITLMRPRIATILAKLKPSMLKVHASLLTDAPQATEFLASLSASRELGPLIATDVAGAENLPALWAHLIDYVQADFLGAPRAQLDFSFVPVSKKASG
jgi:PleD family two-component response regulator/EAL domain-containing protein (putative c-di-GMP-specific phosphodiesterase class I)